MVAHVPVRRSLSSCLAVLTILVGTGCGDMPLPLEVDLDRETFVATYVDLRLAALETPDGRLPEPRRDSILRVHGVTAEQLLEFAEVRGRDPEYMSAVWDEVLARMDGEPVGTPDAGSDTIGGGR